MHLSISQPQINQKSKKIASRKQSNTGKNVAERLYHDAKTKQLMRNVVSSGGQIDEHGLPEHPQTFSYHSQMQSLPGPGSEHGTQLLQLNTFAQHLTQQPGH